MSFPVQGLRAPRRPSDAPSLDAPGPTSEGPRPARAEGSAARDDFASSDAVGAARVSSPGRPLAGPRALELAAAQVAQLDAAGLARFEAARQHALARAHGQRADGAASALELPAGGRVELTGPQLVALGERAETRAGALAVLERMARSTVAENTALATALQRATPASHTPDRVSLALPDGARVTLAGDDLAPLYRLSELRDRQLRAQSEGDAHLAGRILAEALRVGVLSVPVVGSVTALFESARGETLTGSPLAGTDRALHAAGALLELGALGYQGLRALRASANAQQLALATTNGTTTLGEAATALARMSPEDRATIARLAHRLRSADTQQPLRAGVRGALGEADELAAIRLLRRAGVHAPGPHELPALAAARPGHSVEALLSSAPDARSLRSAAALELKAPGLAGPRPSAPNPAALLWSREMPAAHGATAGRVMEVSARGTHTDRLRALLHEHVHAALAPRAAALNTERLRIAQGAYERSQLAQYVEEALAEGFSQLHLADRGGALAALREGMSFPLHGGYRLSLRGVATEAAVGAAVVGGATLYVYLEASEPTPRAPSPRAVNTPAADARAR